MSPLLLVGLVSTVVVVVVALTVAADTAALAAETVVDKALLAAPVLLRGGIPAAEQRVQMALAVAGREAPQQITHVVHLLQQESVLLTQLLALL